MFLILLYDNQNVLDYLLRERGRLVHLYGEADAGRTSVLFSLIGHLTEHGHPCAYLAPIGNQIQVERFRRYVKDPALCPLAVVPDRKLLPGIITELSEAADYLFLDCFLSYILYRTRRQNASLMSFLSGCAYGKGTSFILCNDTRHVPGDDTASPAYMEVFRRYSSRNVLVYKDAAADIYYSFKDW